MEALQQAVRANVGVASAPVALRRQVDNWSCVYCCLQMVLDYLAAHASGYAARLERLGLVDAEGCAVSAKALHAAIARESTVAPAARKKITLHQATAALGPLRTSLIQITVGRSSKAETAYGVVATSWITIWTRPGPSVKRLRASSSGAGTADLSSAVSRWNKIGPSC